MRYKYPIILTIAGSDSSGGAGIQADLKTITVLKCYGATVITALTAQNTIGVQGIFPIPEDFIGKQLDSVFSDIKVDAVKIGMLHNESVIRQVASKLKEFKAKNIVLDPVMVSTSGDNLLEERAKNALIEELFPIADLITPNIREAETVSGLKISNDDEIFAAMEKIIKMNLKNILIKSGDLENTGFSNDLLFEYESKKLHWFKQKRIDTINSHGTGCTLSSAIASYLGYGYSLKKSIDLSKKFLTGTIRSAKHLELGHGRGPVDHLYKC